jgi:hypothetical protein
LGFWKSDISTWKRNVSLWHMDNALAYCLLECFLCVVTAWFLEGFDGRLPGSNCDYGVGNQPNIHPGSITSTGRQRVGPGTATSTQAAQLIGGGISPTLFTSPVSMHISNIM